jgi:hypothetical protein
MDQKLLVGEPWLVPGVERAPASVIRHPRFCSQIEDPAQKYAHPRVLPKILPHYGIRDCVTALFYRENQVLQ